MPAARPRKQAAKGNKFPPEFRYSTNADSTPSVKWAKRRDSTGYRDAKAPRESAFEELRRTAQAYRFSMSSTRTISVSVDTIVAQAKALDAALLRAAKEGKE